MSWCGRYRCGQQHVMWGCTFDWRKMSLSLLCVDSVLLALQSSCWVIAWSQCSTACWCVDRHVNDLLGWLTLETLTPLTHVGLLQVLKTLQHYFLCVCFLCCFFFSPTQKSLVLKCLVGSPLSVCCSESLCMSSHWLCFDCWLLSWKPVPEQFWQVCGKVYVDLTEPMKRSVRQVSFVPLPPPPPPMRLKQLACIGACVHIIEASIFVYSIDDLDFLFYVGLMFVLWGCGDFKKKNLCLFFPYFFSSIFVCVLCAKEKMFLSWWCADI